MILGEFNCKLRVLIVATSPLRRRALAEKVRLRFDEVFYAEGVGAALIEDGCRKVKEYCCHVAVIAPGLPLPADLGAYLDKLVDSLSPAGVVICATRADDRLAFQAGRRGLEYLRHSDPASDLCAAIEAQGRQRCQCQLSVGWPSEDFSGEVARTLRLDPVYAADHHLYDLMGRVFSGANRLELKLLPSLKAGSHTNSAGRRALVLWASEQHPLSTTQRIPKVVKIGPRDVIEREAQNYRHYVDGWLIQNRQARMETCVLSWNLGAIVYAFLGVSLDDVASFRHFYADSEGPDEILDILRRLFSETCRNWYHQERQVMEHYRLYDLYAERLNIEERLRRVGSAHPTLIFPGVSMPLPNPAYWILDEGMAKLFDEVTTCITHGDLHADNFFVDKSGVAWLIDFEQTGPAHALRDFVELEADIKLRLTSLPEDNFSSLAELDRSLLTGQTLSAVLTPTPEIASDPDLLKAFEVITGLRHLAYLTTGVNNQEEYLHALLYETLFMATYSKLNPAIQQRALLSSALIVERLMEPVL